MSALEVFVSLLGIVVGGIVAECSRLAPVGLTTGGRRRTATAALLAVLSVAGGTLGLLWCLLTPPLFSAVITEPPADSQNDPAASVYFGQGCFWHTQFDFWQLEVAAGDSPFGGRSAAAATALVGYAGGQLASLAGAVCYHGNPATDYNRLGHAEAVSVTLDAGNATRASAQLAALVRAATAGAAIRATAARHATRLSPS